MVRVLAFFLLAFTCNSAYAQTGRAFVSVEAHVGASRFVHVGYIETLEQTQFPPEVDSSPDKPVKYGKPYRVVFRVTESIRGDKVDTVELILSLQYAHDLQVLRDSKVELLLVGGSSQGDMQAKIGVQEQGKPVPYGRYSFRILGPIKSSNTNAFQSIEGQLNVDLDSGRMFGLDFTVANSRSEVLQRARAFAKKHPEELALFWVLVPNEFGVQCGYTNAYCIITLPVCRETETMLVNLLRSPHRVVRFAPKSKMSDTRQWFLVEIINALAHFPSPKNAELIRKFASKYEPLPLRDGSPAPGDVRRAADRVLASWHRSYQDGLTER